MAMLCRQKDFHNPRRSERVPSPQGEGAFLAPCPKLRKGLRQGIVLLCLLLVLAGCRGAPPASTPAPPTAVAAASPAPTPSPQPWPEGVLFYEIEEPEQTCLGYQEYLSLRETITQIKIVCTQEGVETVYFIDTEKQTVTVVRIPIPLTNKPEE